MYGLEEMVSFSSETLDEVELKLLLAILGKVLESEVTGLPEKGTIVLYEQKRGEEAKLVFAVNLKEGEEAIPDDDGQRILSKKMAMKAAKGLLFWPENEIYNCYADPVEFGQLKTGVYYGCDNYFALALNTTLGRFVMSSYIGFATSSMSEMKLENAAVLMTIVDILRQFRWKDVVLKRSYLLLEREFWLAGEMKKFLPIVRDIFYHKNGCEDELKAWGEWQTNNFKVREKNGLLPENCKGTDLYFEC